MNFLTKAEAIQKMNQLGQQRTPFLFIASYDTTKNIVLPLDEISNREISYDFQGNSNCQTSDQANSVTTTADTKPVWNSFPIPFQEYDSTFQPLMHNLKNGTTNLANLTFPTEIQCNLTLPEIFARTTAKYRIYLKDYFCSFSPETFVTIQENTIATFPMKGTINTQVPNAEAVLLNNPKEIDEHETVAKEALRDISLVAENARISQFRYVDRVERGDGAILQTSSKIEGDLPENFHEALGDLLYRLLPAGSITGSPKAITTELLETLETYDRGFYSGVAGIYDGENLDSAVLIRYLEAQQEKKNNESATDQSLFQYTFKSGGGITAMSQAQSEYDELIEKIYLPIS
ncbi:aminodeoxychorismate synthase component I [Ignatzschineria sp. LJL83]